MKKFILFVLWPTIFSITAIGASFYLGLTQGQKLDEAEAQLSAPPKSPQWGATRARANAAPTEYLSVEDAGAEIEYILEGHPLPGPNGGIFGILLQMKPDEAVKLLADWPDINRGNMLQQLALRWARQDAKAALEWVGTLSPEDAQRLYTGILLPIGAEFGAPFARPIDPRVAAQYLDKLTNPSVRDRAVNVIATGLARTDPEGALSWLGQNATGDTYTRDVTNLFTMLASPQLRSMTMDDGTLISMPSNNMSNPSAAVALLAKLGDPSLRTAAIGQIATGWAQLDPEAAAQWAVNLPATDSAARASALNTIVAGWTVNDPASAVAFMEKSGDPAMLLPSAPGIADALSKIDTQGALNFVQKLPDGVAKDQALNNILVNIAPQDFSTAWNFAANLPEGTSRDAAMISLISAQANQDPTQAADLIYELSGDIAQQNAARALAKSWVAQDPQAATEWMQTLPMDPIRNGAVAELIIAQVDKNPAATFQWANTITTDTNRTNAIQYVVANWAKTDLAAALNALQSANITDEQRAAMTQMINQAQAKAK